jgi:hypothetical protein
MLAVYFLNSIMQPVAMNSAWKTGETSQMSVSKPSIATGVYDFNNFQLIWLLNWEQCLKNRRDLSSECVEANLSGRLKEIVQLLTAQVLKTK